jgi:hypothetical protein
MAKEPVLTYKLSDPSKFQCSLCMPVAQQGAFTPAGDVDQLIDAFRIHVERFHADEI